MAKGTPGASTVFLTASNIAAGTCDRKPPGRRPRSAGSAYIQVTDLDSATPAPDGQFLLAVERRPRRGGVLQVVEALLEVPDGLGEVGHLAVFRLADPEGLGDLRESRVRVRALAGGTRPGLRRLGVVLVTEMRELKQYYSRGVRARVGTER